MDTATYTSARPNPNIMDTATHTLARPNPNIMDTATYTFARPTPNRVRPVPMDDEQFLDWRRDLETEICSWDDKTARFASLIFTEEAKPKLLDFNNSILFTLDQETFNELANMSGEQTMDSPSAWDTQHKINSAARLQYGEMCRTVYWRNYK
jgi:hypothetical protein